MDKVKIYRYGGVSVTGNKHNIICGFPRKNMEISTCADVFEKKIYFVKYMEEWYKI
jgi:hypothetical protein